MSEKIINDLLKNLYLAISAYSLKTTTYVGKNNDTVFEIRIRRNDFKHAEDFYTKHEAKINVFLVKEVFKVFNSIFKLQAELFKKQGGNK